MINVLILSGILLNISLSELFHNPSSVIFVLVKKFRECLYLVENNIETIVSGNEIVISLSKLINIILL